MTYIAEGYFVHLFVKDVSQRRLLMIKNSTRYGRFALNVMNVKTQVTGAERELDQSGRLWVSNHMSWLDLLIMASIRPVIFVTSVDMGEIPFLGWMTKAGGSIFVERRNREKIQYDIQQIREALKAGFNVVLFPEGTSTDGSAILPFKRSLMTAVQGEPEPLLPLTLFYKKINGSPFSKQNRDYVCWYGRMSFVPHLISLFSRSSVEAEIYVHPPLSYPTDIGKEEMAGQVHDIVASRYGSHGQ